MVSPWVLLKLNCSQHAGRHFPQARGSVDCHKLDGNFCHGALHSDACATVGKFDRYAQCQATFGSLGQLCSCKLHSVNDAAKVLVAESTGDDGTVDVLDAVQSRLLFC